MPAGDTRYRLTALDAAGRPLRSVETDPVDPATPTPLPFAPEQVAVDVTSDGFVLSWAEPQNLDAAPIVGYRITRVDGAAETDLTPDLVLRAAKGAGGDQPGRLTFVDRDPVRDHPTCTRSPASICSAAPARRNASPCRWERWRGLSHRPTSASPPAPIPPW